MSKKKLTRSNCRKAMTRRLLLSLILLLAVALTAEGAPRKPKKVKCKDKKFYDCFKKKDLFCPETCPRSCEVNCASCQPVCSVPPLPTPPSPPPITYPAPTPPTNPNPTPSYTPPQPPTPPVATPSPPPPDGSDAAGGKRVRCKNKAYRTCYAMEHRCPAACPDYCEVDCVTCSPVCNCNKPGAVCQDPRFIGADGITFYFHGKKDKEFCIVTDSNLHINAHFIGRRNANMGRDFTWVQSLGILFDNHQIFVGAQKTASWDNSVDHLDLSFNGKPVFLPASDGAKQQPASGVSVTRSGRDTNSVVIEVEGNFRIRATVVPITEKESKIHKYGITEEDCFAHLDLGFKFYSLSGEVNGVLGQTYARNYTSRVKMGIDMPVLGGQREFASSSIYSTDCAVARFNNTNSLISSNTFQYANLNCATGLDGRGVVCKR
ncbi:late embryogenesis abundant protein-related/LEA protein-related [Forsythia ovata]|uniref:Late embryogenesis abundant protein-related/LEA protein-related n=1 Tax=Forsythia ovata TaxID=205694 RepID=A0ABD1W5H6_9LAMI